MIATSALQRHNVLAMTFVKFKACYFIDITSQMQNCIPRSYLKYRDSDLIEKDRLHDKFILATYMKVESFELWQADHCNELIATTQPSCNDICEAQGLLVHRCHFADAKLHSQIIAEMH